jgi:hypothetical protein
MKKPGAMGKPRANDAGTGTGRNQWKKLLQNTVKFILDYMPSHSSRQAVTFTVTTVTSSQLTQFMSPLFIPHQLICLIKSEGGEHISLYLKQKKKYHVWQL